MLSCSTRTSIHRGSPVPRRADALQEHRCRLVLSSLLPRKLRLGRHELATECLAKNSLSKPFGTASGQLGTLPDSICQREQSLYPSNNLVLLFKRRNQ